MTKDQHRTEKLLNEAQVAWLKSRGWQQTRNNGWVHPKLPYLIGSVTMHDAMEQTRADPTLGWP